MMPHTTSLALSGEAGRLRLVKAFKAAAMLLAALAGPASAQTSDAGADPLHSAFAEVLTANVSDGEVNYPGIAGDARFAEYVTFLASFDPSNLATREEQLAYWINAYTALAIQGILNGKSPSSFFGRVGYFKNTKYDVGGDEINLYDLERDIIIPLGEPRIHFAIVCASFSCPKLRSEAYTAENLEEQLEANTRQFINDETRNRFDREKKVAHLSKIFDWFPEDFEQHSGSVLEYVAKYVDDPKLAEELRAGGYKIKHLKYDWSLNGIPPKAS